MTRTRTVQLDAVLIPPIPRRVAATEWSDGGSMLPPTPRRRSRAKRILALAGLGLALPMAGTAAWLSLLDADKAQDKAKLMEQGQMKLPEAVELAEKHVDGRSLAAQCEIQRDAPKPNPPPADRSERASDATAGERLVYEITCFAKERVQVVRVDGLTRSVLGVRSAGPQ